MSILGNKAASITAAAVAAASLAGTAQGAILGSDSFDYTGSQTAVTDGSALVTTSWNGGSGWTSAWKTPSNTRVGRVLTGTIVDTTASPLSFTPTGGTPISGGNNALSITDNGSPVGRTDLLTRDFTLQNLSDVYASVMIRVPTGQSLASGEAALVYLGGTGTPNPNFGIRPYGTASDPFLARYGTSNTSTTANKQSTGGGYSENSTYLLVIKMSKTTATTGSNYDKMDFWVNPTVAQSLTVGTGGYAGQAVLAGGTANIGAVYLSFDNNNTVQFDRLVLGTTWGDVVAVPEPGTAIAGVGGLLALLGRRRRPVR